MRYMWHTGRRSGYFRFNTRAGIISNILPVLDVNHLFYCGQLIPPGRWGRAGGVAVPSSGRLRPGPVTPEGDVGMWGKTPSREL